MEFSFITLCILLFPSSILTAIVSDCPGRIKLSTFNTGLTPHLPGYETRREIIADQLPVHDTDVLCLQEMWFEDDIERLIHQMVRRGFSHYSTIHDGINQLRKPPSFWTRLFSGPSGSPCATWRVVPVVLCYLWACQGTSEISLLMCLEQNCSSYLNLMPQDCISCLVMSLSNVRMVLDRCVSSREFSRFNTQGLMLFSKKRILKASHDTFQNENIRQILPRGYIEAQIKGIGKIICTHFTVNASRQPIEDNLPYNSTESQQADEIDILHEKFKTTDHIILGDLNTGPFNPSRNLWSDFPRNYQKLKDKGYISPYEMMGGSCTYCTYNTVQNNRSTNTLVDHILLRGQGWRNPRRIFTRRIGKWNLSDHFGLQIDICN